MKLFNLGNGNGVGIAIGVLWGNLFSGNIFSGILFSAVVFFGQLGLAGSVHQIHISYKPSVPDLSNISDLANISSLSTVPSVTSVPNLSRGPSLSKSRAQGLVVIDFLTFDSLKKQIEITLHKNLNLEPSKDFDLKNLGSKNSDDLSTRWLLTFHSPTQSVELKISGNPETPILDGEALATLAADFLLLMDSAHWYPHLQESELPKFAVTADLPAGWSFVAQKNDQPQESLDFIAAPFFVTELKSQDKVFRTYLRKQDAQLAERFLKITPEIVERYEKLLGPYPYSEMNVVENLYETGYGMAGFTLLGPSVLRLPFLTQSSYPHEILHNWWGNGVYVKPEDGNWCEGLTTYLADHYEQGLLKQDPLYRLKALMGFSDYVSESTDFPLRKFQGKYDEASQAIGYGKSMMFFHMLKNMIGEENFLGGLSEFYKSHLHTQAGFSELQVSFEKSSGQKLSSFFESWLDQSGAPEIAFAQAPQKSVSAMSGETLVSFTLTQKNHTPKFSQNAYDLPLRVRLLLRDGSIKDSMITLAQPEKTFMLQSKQDVLSVQVDPDFETMRLPAQNERPSSLSQLFSSTNPSVLDSMDLNAHQGFLEALEKSMPTTIPKVKTWPQNHSPVVVFGSSDDTLSLVKETLLSEQLEFNAKTALKLKGVSYDLSTHSFVFVTKRKTSDQILVWVLAAPGMNQTEWVSRLKHYASFNTLIFKERQNIKKETWLAVTSPLLHRF